MNQSSIYTHSTDHLVEKKSKWKRVIKLILSTLLISIWGFFSFLNEFLNIVMCSVFLKFTYSTPCYVTCARLAFPLFFWTLLKVLWFFSKRSSRSHLYRTEAKILSTYTALLTRTPRCPVCQITLTCKTHISQYWRNLNEIGFSSKIICLWFLLCFYLFKGLFKVCC